MVISKHDKVLFLKDVGTGWGQNLVLAGDIGTVAELSSSAMPFIAGIRVVTCSYPVGVKADEIRLATDAEVSAFDAFEAKLKFNAGFMYSILRKLNADGAMSEEAARQIQQIVEAIGR